LVPLDQQDLVVKREIKVNKVNVDFEGLKVLKDSAVSLVHLDSLVSKEHRVDMEKAERKEIEVVTD